MTAFERIVRASARRPARVLAVVAVLAIVGCALAVRMEPSAATDTLVGRGDDSFQATERYRERFGDHSVIVLARGELPNLVLTSNLGRLMGLEGCLSGNKPEGEQAPGGSGSPCDRLAQTKPVQVVYGPGTFINAAAGELQEQMRVQTRTKAAEAERAAQAARRVARAQGKPPAEQRRLARSARQLVYAQFVRDLLQLNLRYGLGLNRLPSVDDPEFVSALVFDASRGATTPKARFAYLFPSKESAVVQVRLKPGLSDEQRREAVALVREAVRMPEWRLTGEAGYTVTGAPVVAEDLTDALAGSTLRLLIAGVVLMAVVLALVFRGRLRLVPLAVALAAVAITFGASSLLGLPLTMASIAVLPVLLGLGVDYAIQYQARVREEGSAQRAARAAVPVIATAALATGVGFLVLLLSPVPMVRGFGALLVVGIGLGLGCAVTAGFATLVRSGRRRERRPVDAPPAFARPRARMRAAAEAVRASRTGRGIAQQLRAVRLTAIERSERAVARAIDRPQRVLAVALAIAIAGWAVDTQTEVVSDVRELVPQDLQALEDVNELQRATGVSGEIDVTVRADDITRPEVIGWMTRFQQAVLREGGYREGASCVQAKDPPDLCPAFSLPTLLRSVDLGDPAQVNGLLDAVPAYFSQGVVRRDRKVANLAFGIRLQSLEDQKAVVDSIKARIDPPEGVSASVVGLPVLAAEANARLSSAAWRGLTLVIALLAVFLVLLAFRRSRREAAVPLIPIALATGWSAGLLFLLGLLPEPLEVELNPMSVTLGALVIAISTEFSVLLSARYRQERQAGARPGKAIELTYASTGAAVLASGVTAIAGFAVLIASDIKMLRDFGILTVVDLSVSLLGVMLVLPAALVWAERHGPFRWADLDPRPFVRELADAVRSIPLARPRIPRRRRPSVRALRPRLPRRHA